MNTKVTVEKFVSENMIRNKKILCKSNMTKGGR